MCESPSTTAGSSLSSTRPPRTPGTLVILESMKMEMPVEATEDGTVKEIRCKESQPVNEGDVLVVLE